MVAVNGTLSLEFTNGHFLNQTSSQKLVNKNNLTECLLLLLGKLIYLLSTFLPLANLPDLEMWFSKPDLTHEQQPNMYNHYGNNSGTAY